MSIRLSAASASANDQFIFSETAATGTLVLNVRANDGKNASKSLYSLDNGQSADLAAADPVGNPFASTDRSALGATIWINADGTVSYSAASIQARIDALAPGETLQDSFLYALRTTNGAGVWSSVTVTFTGTNDAPVAMMDVAAVDEGSVVSGSVATNDRDVDNGSVLTFATFGGELVPGFVMGTNGSWTFDASNAAYDGLALGETQTVVVNYRVTDQFGASSTSSLQVTVTGTNDAPRAALASSPWQIDEGQSISGQLFGSDADRAAVLRFEAAGELPAGVTVGSDGSFTFDAVHPAYQALAPGEVQSVTLAYRVVDEHGASGFGTMLFTVRGTNDAPVATPGSASLVEDGQASGRLTASDPDAGAVVSFALAGAAPEGFALGADGSWSFDASGATWQGLRAGEVATVEVPVTVSDGQGGASVTQVVLTVTGTNDGASVSGATVIALTEDDVYGSADVTISDADASEANFADYDYVEGGYGYAFFAPALDGATAPRWSYEVKDDPVVQALAEGEAVTDSFTVASVDGTPLTFTVVMTGVNDGPVAEDATASLAEDGSLTGQLVATDIDHGAVLSFAVEGESPAGFVLAADGSWSFDAGHPEYQALAAGQMRSLSIAYLVTDEHGATSPATLSLTVTGSNDGPVPGAGIILEAGPEDTPFSFDIGALLAGWSDPEGDPLEVTAVTASSGSISISGTTVTYQPASDEHGSVVLSYQVGDSRGATAAGEATFTIAPVNDAPRLGSSSTLPEQVEDTAFVLTQQALLAGWVDPEGSPLQVTQVSFGNGVVTANADGSFGFTPAANFNGLATISVTASDGQLSRTEQMTFTIRGVNDSATISGTKAGFLVEDQFANPAAVTSVSWDLNSVDPDGANDRWTVVSDPVSSNNGFGSYRITATGQWTYTLDNGHAAVNGLATGQTLTDSFTVSTEDGTSQLVTVTIQGRTDFTIVAPDVSGADANDFDDLRADQTKPDALFQNVGTAGDDIYDGSDAADTLSGSQGADVLYGHGGRDYLYGGAPFPQEGVYELGADTLYGQAGADEISGGNGTDLIYGGSGNDWISGDYPGTALSADRIYGGSGDDFIEGDGGNDILIGGLGRDSLYGEEGADTYIYLSINDGGDIVGFSRTDGDRIDLTAIDANLNVAGDQAFLTASGPAAYSLWMTVDGSYTLLCGDIDGNAGTAEFMIKLGGTGFMSGSTPFAGIIL